jgi:hypothetical protein
MAVDDEQGRDTYLYDAFIGHAHVLRDRKWAEWLANALENFPAPLALEPKGHPLWRKVFRDKNERSGIDLRDDVKGALMASRFLVVVCSHLTPGSERIAREIDLFLQLGRGDRVLAVLTEGEPRESLPAILLERYRAGQSDNGDIGVIDDEGPLAADVRPRAGFSLTKIQRLARQHLNARVLGVPFAELKGIEARQRRHNSRMLARFPPF